MEHAEVFHIYHHGEQRGPYSVRQVNHLYRCGYICEETLYWRDGMEQWQPVTEIVERRMQRKRLRRWAIVAAVCAVLAVLVFLFGPVTRDAWKELTSGEYTADSAWWRARGLVREKLQPEGEHVSFDARSTANVELDGKNQAVVVLGGQVTDAKDKAARQSWTVHLQFDSERRLWQSTDPAGPALVETAAAVPANPPAPEAPAPATAEAPAPATAEAPAPTAESAAEPVPASPATPVPGARAGSTASNSTKVVAPE